MPWIVALDNGNRWYNDNDMIVKDNSRTIQWYLTYNSTLTIWWYDNIIIIKDILWYYND